MENGEILKTVETWINSLSPSAAPTKYDSFPEIRRQIDDLVQLHNGCCWSLRINTLDLLLKKPDIATWLLIDHEKALSFLGDRLRAVYNNLTDHSRQNFSNKRTKINVRLFNLPFQCLRHNLSSFRVADIGRMFEVSGRVTRITSAKVRVDAEYYVCLNEECKYRSSSPNGKAPKVCKNCNLSCGFQKLADETVYSDYQEFFIQQLSNDIVKGAPPTLLKVIVMDDLVDSVVPGEEIKITGVLKHDEKALHMRSNRIKLFTVVDKIFIANCITKRNHVSSMNLNSDVLDFNSFWKKWREMKQPLRGRDQIVKSICPSLYGMYLTKLSLLLCLIGSYSVVNEDKTRIRGDSHLLVVGDPGKGKSKLLQFAAKVCDKSIYTNGQGSSAAGLTCAAIKQKEGFSLEAGALVLADGGVCCIDEFGRMKASDRASMHEAMEQQKISVAKAGIVASLNSRTTIVAAANPLNRYDFSKTMSENLGIKPPLLSRFDLIILLLESNSTETHEAIADHILGIVKDDEQVEEASEWSLNQMRQYIEVCKTFKPTLSEAAEEILLAYYQEQQCQNTLRDSGLTTARLLEGLIRLSKAHARLMWHKDEVTTDDALMAVFLVDNSRSLHAGKFENKIDPFQIGFVPEIDSEFKIIGDEILSSLGLQNLRS